MTSTDVDLVVRAVLGREFAFRQAARRIAVVAREPARTAGFGLTILARDVCADPRVRRRFGGHVCRVTAGTEATWPGGNLGIRYRRNARLAGDRPPPFHHWLLAEERILRDHRRLLLVVDDVRDRHAGGWPSTVRGHVNLTMVRDPAFVPEGTVVLAVDAVAVERAALAALAALPPADADRVAELGVFAADEAVPLGLVRDLWRVTAGLPASEADELVGRLAGLGLVHPAGATLSVDPAARAVPPPGDALGRLLEDLAARVPRVEPLLGAGADRAWWDLDPAGTYLWEHLVTHLAEAGRATEAELLATDLRWVAARVARTGPAGPLRDLVAAASGSRSDSVDELLCVYGQVARRLDPADPPEAILDTLLNSVEYHDRWRYQVEVLRSEAGRPMLVNRRQPADDPQAGDVPLAGSGGWGLDVSPDGTLLAVAGGGKFVTCVDLATGERVQSMKCYSKSQSVVFGPDGSWLAVRTWDQARMPGVEDPPISTTVQIWDVAEGVQLFEVQGRWRRHISSMALSPDGTRLGIWREDGVEIWDWRANRPVPSADLGPWLPVHHRAAGSPDGAWRATLHNAELRLWDVRADRPGPLTRVSGPLLGLRWLAESQGGILVYGEYGVYVFDVRGP